MRLLFFPNAGVRCTPSKLRKLWSARTENIAGHAAVGCASSVASGGKCDSGALSAGVSAWATPQIPNNWKTQYQVVAISVVGGTTSVIGGGKFENGAVTAAFGYLFNHCSHDSSGCSFFDRVNERYSETSEFIDSAMGSSILPRPADSPEEWAATLGGGMAAKDYGGRTVFQETTKIAKEYKNTSFSLFRTVARPDVVRAGTTTAINAVAVTIAWNAGLYVGSIIYVTVSGDR